MPRLTNLRPRLEPAPARITGLSERPTYRIRGRALQAIREQHFRTHPLCAACLAMRPERITIARELDHITPLSKGGTDAPANLQGLCTPCHEAKSKAEGRGG